MKISKPPEKEHNTNSPQNSYIQAVTAENALLVMTKNIFIVDNFSKSLPTEKHFYYYLTEKWTPIEVFDYKRILVYRARHIAHNKKQSLSGFDEANYVTTTSFNKKSRRSLLFQYKAQRKSTILLCKSFIQQESSRLELANNWST